MVTGVGAASACHSELCSFCCGRNTVYLLCLYICWSHHPPFFICVRYARILLPLRLLRY